MNAKYLGAIAIAAALTVGTVACGGTGADPCAGTTEEEVDPCAGTADPCAGTTEEEEADPCAGS
jgi:hypothetical protein